MNDPAAVTGAEQRRSARVDIDAPVTIELLPGTYVGPGENISEQGVYFRVEGAIPVRVRIGDDDTVRPGELVRVDNLGDGGVGIAVRFAEPVR
ncbi:MAG: PilZ domain-containing protein [Planctomycetes bacterium]|nr:PilZ domain-containing protein [Planctomycetota bacterium]